VASIVVVRTATVASAPRLRAIDYHCCFRSLEEIHFRQSRSRG